LPHKKLNEKIETNTDTKFLPQKIPENKRRFLSETKISVHVKAKLCIDTELDIDSQHHSWCHAVMISMLLLLLVVMMTLLGALSASLEAATPSGDTPYFIAA